MGVAPSLAEQSLTIRAQADAIARQAHGSIGRPPVIADPERVQVLLAALTEGNYRETACLLADIPKRSFYNAFKSAEAGDEAAMAFVYAVEKAEAQAESGIVRNVRKASESPQFWAAGMTLLERKSPDKWGRRQDDQSVPRVVVQIGVRDSDVSVNVSTVSAHQGHIIDTPNAVLDASPVAATTYAEPHKLTEDALSDVVQGAKAQRTAHAKGRR